MRRRVAFTEQSCYSGALFLTRRNSHKRTRCLLYIWPKALNPHLLTEHTLLQCRTEYDPSRESHVINLPPKEYHFPFWQKINLLSICCIYCQWVGWTHATDLFIVQFDYMFGITNINYIIIIFTIQYTKSTIKNINWILLKNRKDTYILIDLMFSKTLFHRD